MTEIPQKELDKIFADLDKMNPDATYLSENTLSNVKEYIDTGCMSLNAIISGSLYGGVPKGRITGFSGPSMSGKSYIMNKIHANAQKGGMIPVIFDSEIAVDKQSAENVGLDIKRVKYVPVDTVEQCRNQMFSVLDNIEKNPAMYGKFILGVDSLGNLSTSKELKDALEGSSAMDMGLKAKALKSMMRVLTFKAAKSNTTILFANHLIDNPGEMHPSMVKIQSGGKGPIYLASVLVQLSTKNKKQDEKNVQDQMLPGARNFSGVTMRALTVKNRFIPQFLECEMYLNFKTGLDLKEGLFEMAVSHGVIINTGSTHITAEGEKLGYYGNFKNKEELWSNYILPNLEKKIQAAYRYGNTPISVVDNEEEEESVE